MDKPDFMRNIVVLGSIHHGKTTFLDMLIESTHVVEWSDDIDVYIIKFNLNVYCFKNRPVTLIHVKMNKSVESV